MKTKQLVAKKKWDENSTVFILFLFSEVEKSPFSIFALFMYEIHFRKRKVTVTIDVATATLI